VSLAQDAPIIQPGAPGDAARELTAEEAIEITELSYSPADKKLARELKSLAKALQKEGGDGVTAKRRAGLAETLSGIAAGLR
jgi:hypothetical protein